MARYSLTLNGGDVLDINFHRRWLKFLEQAESTSISLKIDCRVLIDLEDISEWVANNKIFLPKKGIKRY